MSRHRSAASPSSRATGRHRVGAATGVRCADIPAVRERMQVQRPAVAHRGSLLRWMFQTPTTGRHTWSFLAGSGGRPRTAFAIILSL